MHAHLIYKPIGTIQKSNLFILNSEVWYFILWLFPALRKRKGSTHVIMDIQPQKMFVYFYIACLFSKDSSIAEWIFISVIILRQRYRALWAIQLQVYGAQSLLAKVWHESKLLINVNNHNDPIKSWSLLQINISMNRCNAKTFSINFWHLAFIR